MLFLHPFADLVTCLDSKIPSRKKSSLEKSTAIRVVTASLLITEKGLDIFLQEPLSTWELRI